MKLLLPMLVLVAVIGFAALWLHASPHSTQAIPPAAPARQLPTPGSSPTASSSIARPLASTAHTVGTAAATPSVIPIGTSTQVTVTIPITDPAVIPNSVNLLRLGAPGNQPVILGQMQNASNGIYSIQPSFNESTAGQVQLQVSAAFQGSLQRVLSNTVTVNVWSVLIDPSSGFTVQYPPSLYSTSNTAGTFLLQSSPQGVSIGGVGPEDGSSATTNGFAVIIYPSQYTGNFDINTWLSMKDLLDEVDTETPIVVGGVPAYKITFKNVVGAARPTVVVHNQHYIYQISYASTFTPGSPADQYGLSAFNAVLQSFTFSH